MINKAQAKCIFVSIVVIVWRKWLTMCNCQIVPTYVTKVRTSIVLITLGDISIITRFIKIIIIIIIIVIIMHIKVSLIGLFV